MNKTLLKNIGIYAAITAFFLILSYAFVPEVLGGKIVNQSDISGWQGMAKESLDWNAAHPGDKTGWSDSMFGGMPNITFVDDLDGDWIKPIYKALLWGRRPATYLFIALIGAFLMMLAFGIDKFLAVAGAIAVAFCSYNFQIIQVGHNTKMQAIAFAPWVIAAMAFTFRTALGERRTEGHKWLPQSMLGAALFGLALSFQIKANHVQITYYLAIIVLIYAVATLVWLLRRENRHLWKRFATASALLLVLGLAGIGTNANKLIPTAKYAPYTMRGGSELTQEGANEKGLSLDYATAWSYGIQETPNLLIPNYNGGSSNGSLGKKSATWALFKRAGQDPSRICANLPLYWGPQPFTAGPMYIGAISIFLFILGLCLVQGREKWSLAVCCLLAILLAWGSHFMPFTRLWFEYVPMYNKFRTVSMALVVLQFCVPLLGIYTLDRILKDEIPHRKVVRSIWTALGISAGFCLLCGLIPGIAGNFKAPSDAGMQDILVKALQQDRRHLLQADAWRSFLLIVAAAAVIMWCYLKPDPAVQRKRTDIAMAIVGVLILFDMWGAGKRYLNSGDFITPRDFSAQLREQPVDKAILQDSTVSYRVLDLARNTFNSSVASYRHKSIGGYSPTKMQRAQDLIDRYISGEIRDFSTAASGAATLEEMQAAVPYMPVVSMLNGKYIIIGEQYPPVVNPYAFGTAWFVKGVQVVSSADEEIDALGQVDLHETAVVREDAPFGTLSGIPEAGSNITLESYAPNELRYSFNCREKAVAVFSEVYHPSWKAEIDGKPLELFRADWLLRAAVIPEGCGEIVMRYCPEDYVKGAAISRICSILLLLLAAGALAGAAGLFDRLPSCRKKIDGGDISVKA